jgi:hypothetical protein
MDVEDRYYASSELAQMAMIIAKDGSMLHNMKSSAYKKYVLKMVRGSDKVLKLVWQVAENTRLSSIEEAHREICQTWMKEYESPEWSAWMNLVRFNKRLDKMINVTLGRVIENIGLCCGEILEDDVVDIWGDVDLLNARAELDDEFEVQGAHRFIELSKEAINNSLNYSTIAAKIARGVMITKQYQLVRSEEWRKKMGLSLGKPLAFPMSDDDIMAQMREISPSTEDELL